MENGGVHASEREKETELCAAALIPLIMQRYAFRKVH